jgi:hypothetical protein
MSSTFFPIFPCIENKKYISFRRNRTKVSPKSIASCPNCWYNLQRWGFLELYAAFIPLPKLSSGIYWISRDSALRLSDEEVAFMATNSDFGHSALLSEQYQRDMELIAVALQEESQDEREDRLGLVVRSWALTTTCFQAQNDTSDILAEAHVTLARQ